MPMTSSAPKIERVVDVVPVGRIRERARVDAPHVGDDRQKARRARGPVSQLPSSTPTLNMSAPPSRATSAHASKNARYAAAHACHACVVAGIDLAAPLAALDPEVRDEQHPQTARVRLAHGREHGRAVVVEAAPRSVQSMPVGREIEHATVGREAHPGGSHARELGHRARARRRSVSLARVQRALDGTHGHAAHRRLQVPGRRAARVRRGQKRERREPARHATT